jgi:hypothetical protein
MKPRNILVATHGHCFDGLASAAVFTRFLGALREGTPLEARYRSCGYGPGMSAVPEAWLDGDENAILDFRYTESRRLSWYFDHHITAFSSPEEQSTALERAALPDGGIRIHYAPTYGSCTKLISDVARDSYGIDTSALAELVTWADIIDAARFASAEAAIDRSDPVLRLASVVEHHGDGPFLNDLVPRLVARPLGEVARDTDIQDMFRPLAALQEQYMNRVREKSETLGSVVLVDLTDMRLDAAAKFVTYALYPECVYSVMLTRGKQHCKISVGYNPWSSTPRRHDISAICRRYEGGGHPVVGAASFPLSDVGRAREAARTIARELDT